jgi:hypothetical protein
MAAALGLAAGRMAGRENGVTTADVAGYENIVPEVDMPPFWGDFRLGGDVERTAIDQCGHRAGSFGVATP